MLKKTSLFVLLSVVTLLSCKNKDKEEDCVAPAIEKNIVAVWKVVAKVDGETSDMSNVEFKSDGTLIDTDDMMVEAEINGIPLPDKSWEIKNGKLEITARGANNAMMTVPPLSIQENKCKKIVLDFLGLGTLEMTR